MLPCDAMPALTIRIAPLLVLCACGTVQPDEGPAADAARRRDELIADAASCATGPRPGLLAYWRLNEGAGQFVQDASGNGSRGRLGPSDGAEAGDPSWILSVDPFPR